MLIAWPANVKARYLYDLSAKYPIPDVCRSPSHLTESGDKADDAGA